MLPRTFVNAAAITPSDTAANEFDAIYVGATGTLKVTTVGGQAVTFVAVPAGATIYVKTKLVWATGTAAGSLVGLRG
jgi:hypothetical protein